MLEAGRCAAAVRCHAAYHADGCFTLAHDVQLMSRNVLDYTFTSAPVDWLGEGDMAADDPLELRAAMVISGRVESRRCRALA